MKVVYVVLHYQVAQETICCVESLLQNARVDEQNILIVDNGSSNNSAEILAEKYADVPNVLLVKAGANLGFANGNNLGYQYARETLGADIVAILNNDIVVEDARFTNKLVQACTACPDAAVLAPDIITPLGIHQNPARTDQISIQQVRHNLRYNRFLNFVLRIPIVRKILVKYLVKRRNKIELEKAEAPVPETDLTNIVPHGAFVIFNKQYLLSQKLAFNPKTFLYCEEELLYEHLMRNGMQSRFYPALQVKHLEDCSTNAITDNNQIKKRLFLAKHKIKSLKILLSVLKSENEDY